MATLTTAFLLLITFLSGNVALAAGGYTYMGCYADSDTRVLPYWENWDILQTTSGCVNHCRVRGYEYAGTEFSWQCFCGTSGNFASLAPAVSDDACNMACPGKPSENCGGVWRISVHAVLALSDEVRLVGGLKSSEGRLEVRVLNTVDWGTVCSEAFDMNDTVVACRMLELGAPVNFTRDATYFGPGTGDIKMANLECSGTEDSLFSCPHDGAGNHSCVHSSDVGVICEGLAKDDAGSPFVLLIGAISGAVVAVGITIAIVCGLVHRGSNQGNQAQQGMAMNQIIPYPTQYGQYTQQPPAHGQYAPEPTQYDQYTQQPTQYDQYNQQPTQYDQYTQQPTQYGQYPQQPTQYNQYMYTQAPTQFGLPAQQSTQ
ncbi:SSC5D [Branchiostoma lanceolatum]|uniref:Soluble scavenger receptor cysteine-rich domain-containing protein SSC5D n=1 Tax=Branchiostoma lanceolatum TaxID=7740 RepID=A0A8J9W5G2_BRALA|nr:SSC5D [Branchiostoma lanceolatum]